jgi:hypothetical protein
MNYIDNDPQQGRVVRLLVEVRGLSGRRYPIGTEVRVRGTGSSVDGYVAGDWIPLAWWEFSEGVVAPTEA